MITREITITLPNDIAQAAEERGLLRPEALEQLIRAEVGRREHQLKPTTPKHRNLVKQAAPRNLSAACSTRRSSSSYGTVISKSLLAVFPAVSVTVSCTV
jgi:hypothetical protein